MNKLINFSSLFFIVLFRVFKTVLKFLKKTCLKIICFKTSSSHYSLLIISNLDYNKNNTYHITSDILIF